MGSSSKTTMTTGAPEGALARCGSGGVSRRPRHGREGEKEDEEEHRGYADDGQEHARGARTHVQERAEAADRRGRSD